MLLVIEHSDVAPLGTLGPILMDHAHRLKVVRLSRGEPLPRDLDDVDGLIVCGGPQSANDTTPVMQRGLELIREAHGRSLPVLGICLGAQMLAKALGGEVGALDPGENGGGPEIGWDLVRLTPAGREDPLFTGIGWTAPQFHWHGEQVTKLPPGARALASSARTKVQAFGVGLRSYGLQYHPEVDERGIQRLLVDGAREMQQHKISADSILTQTRTHLATFERSAQRLFASWTLYVAPSDRKNPGVARDLVH